MKKKVLYICIILGIILAPACNRKGCPGIDKEGKIKSKKKFKGDRGLFPKGM